MQKIKYKSEISNNLGKARSNPFSWKQCYLSEFRFLGQCYWVLSKKIRGKLLVEGYGSCEADRVALLESMRNKNMLRRLFGFATKILTAVSLDQVLVSNFSLDKSLREKEIQAYLQLNAKKLLGSSLDKFYYDYQAVKSATVGSLTVWQIIATDRTALPDNFERIDVDVFSLGRFIAATRKNKGAFRSGNNIALIYIDHVKINFAVMIDDELVFSKSDHFAKDKPVTQSCINALINRIILHYQTLHGAMFSDVIAETYIFGVESVVQTLKDAIGMNYRNKLMTDFSGLLKPFGIDALPENSWVYACCLGLVMEPMNGALP